MIIQNKLEAAAYSMFLRIILGVVGIFIAMMFILTAPFDIFVSRIGMAVILAVYIAFLIRMPHYFIFSDSHEQYILIRYYNVHPLLVKPKQYQIPKEQIADVKIKSLFFGWRKMLLISVYSKNGVANYKPVNISLLKKEQAEKLKKQLLIWRKIVKSEK